MRLVSWNIARRGACWDELARDGTLDLALLQEAVPPATNLGFTDTVPPPDTRWFTAGSGQRPYCAAIARLSERVRLHPIEHVPIGERMRRDQLGVSRVGTVAAADVELHTGERITLASVHAPWENAREGSWIYADASAHRIVSDISVFVGRQRGHRVIVAGDLNILYGYGEGGSVYWRERYASVFARMASLGLPLVGPHEPHGAKADPWPRELPRDSRTVPTFKPNSGLPARQMDFVFASPELHDRLEVAALNDAASWGPSDHCRVSITLRT